MDEPVLWKIVLEYAGAGFEGWQMQPGRRTVQGEVEAALEKLLGHPARVRGAGRTDAGVHALAQVAAFEARVARTPKSIRDGLNHHLGPDLACVDAAVAPPGFDPRRWSWGKTYRYTWLDRPARSPLRDDRAWHVRALDDRAMGEAAACLLGRHDFSTFRAVGCSAAHPIREITAVGVRRDRDEVTLEVAGQGFLRHMVRILAGTLAEVGHGRRPVAGMKAALEARDRSRGGQTAPPHGLTLVEVRYREEGPPPWIQGSAAEGTED